MLVELIGVDKIVPDTVKSSGHCGYGSEKSVAHPYGKHGVFLSERLSGRDHVVVAQSYLPSDPELHGAAYQGYGHKPELGGDVDVGVDYATGGDGCRKRESHSPQIERQPLKASDAAVEAREDSAEGE